MFGVHLFVGIFDFVLVLGFFVLFCFHFFFSS